MVKIVLNDIDLSIIHFNVNHHVTLKKKQDLKPVIIDNQLIKLYYFDIHIFLWKFYDGRVRQNQIKFLFLQVS